MGAAAAVCVTSAALRRPGMVAVKREHHVAVQAGAPVAEAAIREMEVAATHPFHQTGRECLVSTLAP